MTVPNSVTTLTPAQFADVVQGLPFNRPLSGHQATIATAVVASRIADRPMKIRDLHAAAGTTGTAGNTSVDVKKNGATVLNATLDIDNTDADGTKKVSTDFIDEDAQKVEAGDIVTVEVTTAPTAGAALDFTLNLDVRFDPQAEKALLGP